MKRGTPTCGAINVPLANLLGHLICSCRRFSVQRPGPGVIVGFLHNRRQLSTNNMAWRVQHALPERVY